MSKRSERRNDGIESTSVPSMMSNQEQDGLDQAEVAELAYQRWVEKGCPQGIAEEDWLDAEKEVRSRGAAMPQAG